MSDAVNEQDDIFGGDSDLSELSDNEGPSTTRRAPSRSTSPQAAPQADSDAPAGEDDEEEDYDAPAEQEEDEGEDYNDGGEAKKSLKSLKIPKKKRTTEDGDEGAQPKKRKKASRKEREGSGSPAPAEEEEEEEVDPETARRRALNAKLQEIVKRPANKSSRRKRGDDDEDLEMLNDEAIAQLRSKMMIACDNDIEDNEAGRFAIHKLRVLPEVVNLMQKSALADAIIEAGVLEAVRRWLEPLPDKSLPAVNIQRALFPILQTLSIETSALKSSGLGKIVYFYTKCKRVEPSIARMADQLVRDWMRPILRRSKAFSDRDPAKLDFPEPRRPVGGLARTGSVADGSAGGGSAGLGKEKDTARRHARIPEALTATYRVAPQSGPGERGSGGMQAGHHSAAGGSEKMKGYKKKLVASTQASRRV